MGSVLMKLSIIIPIHNEEEILEQEIRSLVSAMNELLQNSDYEITLVENGSLDNTLNIAKKLAAEYSTINVVSLQMPDYGKALKEGILYSRGQYVAVFNIDYWDIDATKKALSLFQDGGCDIVVCSKTMKGARDLRRSSRKIMTRVFNLSLRLLFKYQGTDTHGIKFLSRDKILPLVRQCWTSRAMFDTELLLRAQKEGLRISEIPATCIEKRKSVFGITNHIPRVLKDLVKLFVELRL